MSKTLYDFDAINAALLTGDQALFAAEKRCVELMDEMAAIRSAHEAREPITAALEDELITPLDEARLAAERVIFETMPETLAGAAVKLRLLAHPDRGIDATEKEITALRQVLALVEQASNAPALAEEAQP